MRIAIVVGHNRQAQGAVRVTDRVSEYVWNGDLATRIEKLDSGSVKVFYRTPGAGEISRVYREVAAWKADCAVELHFNAFRTAGAHGCETLHGTSSASKQLAQHLQREMLLALGNRNRGIVRRASGRGSTAVNQRAQPTALIEPYFGSNPSECVLAAEYKDALAQAILNGAREFLGHGPVAVVDEEGPLAHTEMQRLLDAYEEIGDLIASTLATGYSTDLPEDVARMRWRLAEIFQMVAKGEEL